MGQFENLTSTALQCGDYAASPVTAWLKQVLMRLDTGQTDQPRGSIDGKSDRSH